MSESAIRAAIYSAVSGVTDVGKVYDYERYSKEWGDFLDLFQTTIGGTSQIRGWMIGYRGIPESVGGRFTTPNRISRKHSFNILGVMGIDDSEESEKTFAALAEDVCDALDSDATINAFAGVSLATLSFDPRPFAGVLVHAAVIVLEVTEFV